MPKRVIDFDALWASDKLASCAEWAQSEYAWLYGLADASGSFEMTNLRVIWGRVAAVRKNLTLERLDGIFQEFIARGLLFSWEQNGKRYGHWTGSDVPGRLPPRSWRMRLEKLAPPVPREALAAYSSRFGGSKEGVALQTKGSADATASAAAASRAAAFRDTRSRGLKDELEETQAQDWDLGLDLGLDLKKEVYSAAPISDRAACEMQADQFQQQLAASAHQTTVGNAARETSPEDLLEMYEAERGELPPARLLTRERREKCARWLAAGFTAEEFRTAVRRAAATPFLAGAGNRGWRASFDWLIADPSNARKVLDGEYAPSKPAAGAKSRTERPGLADLYAGTGPRPADCGIHVNPAALERIRSRQARLSRMDEGAPLAAASEAPCPDGHRPPRGAPAQVAASREVPDLSPQPIACNAQSRAAPATLKS